MFSFGIFIAFDFKVVNKTECETETCKLTFILILLLQSLLYKKVIL